MVYSSKLAVRASLLGITRRGWGRGRSSSLVYKKEQSIEYTELLCGACSPSSDRVGEGEGQPWIERQEEVEEEE